jgi:hypothetical protein
MKGGDRMDQDDSKNCLDDHSECGLLIFPVNLRKKLWFLPCDHLGVVLG